MLLGGRSKRRDEAALASQGNPKAVLLDRDTGLCQPWYLQYRLEEEVSRCARYKRPFSVILLDMQLLPGEDVPEEAILTVGKVLARALRQIDLGARLERTSFVVVLVEGTDAVAKPVAHRLRSQLTLQVTSIRGRWKAGTATFPDDGVDPDALLQVAARRLREDFGAAA
jgi:diguanylate cyclase (GGDEF)-like protein